MSATKTIIFGASGAVGSAAARAAERNGAKVSLAMRDPTKAIPGLGSGQAFEKVQADLSKPDTVREAVTQTGAKHAFIYCIFEAEDGMRGSIEALKAAGIEFVVFLSSIGIQDDPKDVSADDFTSYRHARVEISLDAVFGPQGYVAIRPAWFASNIFQWNVQDGQAKILYPNCKWDWIAPEDIGTVAGALAAGGPSAAQGHNAIALCGPELETQKDVLTILGSILGKDIKIIELDEAAALQKLAGDGWPQPHAQQVVRLLRARNEETDGFYIGKVFEEARGNILKYGGKEPLTFGDWAAKNKELVGA